MITDALLVLDSANALIRAAGTYVSTNTIDLGVARDIGVPQDLTIFFNVDVAFAGGTQVTIQVITSATANLASPTVIGQSQPILLAALTLGAAFALPVLRQLNSNGQRYFGVQYVSTGTFTTGSISARIVLDVTNLKYFASGFTVL